MARPRKRNETAQQVLPLLLLGIGFVASNNHFTVIDDEAWTINGAIQPVRTILSQFLSGSSQHERAPLFEVILHFWLRWTGGNFEYLRIPAILFFLAGIFLLGRAAARFGGPTSATAVVWLGALWPFGFHYGRLSAWYSFSFFLVAGLTLAYLRLIDKESPGRWAAFFLFGAALLWTNYFGWALLACLAADQFFRHRSGEGTVRPGVLAGAAALLIVSFIPLFRVFRTEIGFDIHLHQRIVVVIANAAFNVYSLFVSESVAPWHWALSIPAGIAVLVCIVALLLNVPEPLRRFFFYSGFLVALMGVTGILATTHLFLIAPWVLLPIGIGVAMITTRWARVGLAAALMVIAGIGWFGIHSRSYYSTVRFLEPWDRLAGDAADKIHGGATVISNNPSFFFYLTYILRVPDQGADWKFAGALPDSVRYPNVMSAEEWMASGHPFAPSVMWVSSIAEPQTDGSMDAASHQLDQACGARISRLMMRDPGFTWKQRLFHTTDGLPWRIEIHEYDCVSSTSPQIFRIPPG